MLWCDGFDACLLTLNAIYPNILCPCLASKIPHYDSQQFSLLKHIHYFIKKCAMNVG